MSEAGQPVSAGPSTPLRINAVRWASSLHVIALVAQVGLALTFLGGGAEAYPHHRTNGWILLGLGGLQALAALANGPTRTGRWLTLVALTLVALEAAQIWFGRTVQTEAHVLLGFVIWSLALGFMIKVWMPAWAEAARAR